MNDVLVNNLLRDRAGGPRRAGPVYVPTSGNIELYYTTSVAASYEAGAIRGFIDAGYITAEFRYGSGAAEGLRNRTGWFDYGDTATTATPISMVADTWTQVTNDGLGATSSSAYAPDGITKLWDTTTNELVFTELDVGDTLTLRFDFTITPIENNARVAFRLNFPAFGGFQITEGLATLSDGAGEAYSRIAQINFYIGSTDVQTTGATIELRCSSAADLTVAGFFIKRT